MHHRILVAFLLVTCSTFGTRRPAAQTQEPSAEPRVIEVLAKRYMFEPSEINAVQGEKLRIMVRSGDGPHGFEIKKFKISKEIARGGDPVVIEFTPTEVGRFPIACSLFCGDGHEDMKGALVITAAEAPQP